MSLYCCLESGLGYLYKSKGITDRVVLVLIPLVSNDHLSDSGVPLGLGSSRDEIILTVEPPTKKISKSKFMWKKILWYRNDPLAILHN